MKKKYYWIVGIVIVLIVIIYISLFFSKHQYCKSLDSSYCNNDEDCICTTLGCFSGNKNYYESCVDKNRMCTDFCYGWSEIFREICENHKCTGALFNRTTGERIKNINP